MGDPDHLVSLAQFLTDMDMEVLYVVTGTPAGPKFETAIEAARGRQDGRAPMGRGPICSSSTN